MPSLSTIVDVQIDRQTAAIAQAGFGTALIVGESPQSVFDDGEVVREYTAVADMLTDGFLPTDPEYLAASRLMGQKNRSPKFMVGLVTLGDSSEVFTYAGTLTSGTVTISVNGVSYSEVFDTDQVTTMTALATALSGDANVGTATWDDGALTMTIESLGGDLNIVPVANGSFTSATQSLAASTSTWATELAAILSANQGWYALIPARYSYSDAIAAADFVSSNDRIMAITLWEQNAVTNAATGLAHAFDTAAYDRVAPYYHQTYGEHLAASSFGERLPLPPGNGTFKFKSLSQTPVSNLSQTQITAASAKNVNLYLAFGENNIVLEGKVASGEFIDIIINTDWLKARITENVFARLVNLPKVEFSDVGFAVVDSAIREVLAQGARRGIVLDDEQLTVSVPKRADISQNDRANRILPDITFFANLSGAVHSASIRGTVSI